jgi:hypothetical protein
VTVHRNSGLTPDPSPASPDRFSTSSIPRSMHAAAASSVLESIAHRNTGSYEAYLPVRDRHAAAIAAAIDR